MFVFSPDIIVFCCLGSKHQLTVICDLVHRYLGYFGLSVYEAQIIIIIVVIIIALQRPN